jgi:hypothetical protein
MEQRLTPAFFCGSAIAALTGLLFGVVLHLPWQKHPGGPQIQVAAAQAAEPAHPAVDDATVDVAASIPVESADLDSGPVTPDPLPVTRLHPELFDVQPAATDETERQDADDLAADVAPPEPRDLD